jgi:hypothetical protein
MASPKKSASWQEMRRQLASKSQKELLDLIRDLYALHPEVKDFLHARFLTSARSLRPYKKTIQEALSPDVVHGEDLDLARGRKAVNDYQKATNDPLGTLELMTHYVECGTQFAVEYHYGVEEFYEDLDEMFTRVVKTLQQSEQEIVHKFLPRLRTIVHEAEDIGWGYGDAVYDTLEDAFPEER